MNFLALCQKVVRDSGTISGDRPVTVTNQTGRLGKIIHFVREAWQEIQNDRPDWQWMEQDFTAQLTPHVSQYSAVSLGIPDLARFLPDTISLHDPVIGPADEQMIPYLERRAFRHTYQIGTTTAPNRPQHITLDTKGGLILGPTPDRAWQMRGLYVKQPQILQADDDMPDCPSRFHMVIAWRALMLLGEHDEDEITILKARRLYRNMRDDLISDETPPVTLSKDFFQ